MSFRPTFIAVLTLTLGACTLPEPYRAPSQPAPVPPAQPETTVATQPAPQPRVVEEPTPLPAPVVREPSLSAASRSLVNQAQTQLTAKNFALAASSVERALRIEPENPLLWIELGKVRQAEGNYVQAENMGRKALSMSSNAPRAQSAAWRLIAESYRARGRNSEAREAEARVGER